MKVSRILSFIVAAAALLQGCSQTPIQRDVSPSTAPSLYYPAGIWRPASPDAARRDGLYADSSQAGCCFLSKSARFTASIPAQARVATFVMYVPEIPYLREHPEFVTASFNGARGSKTLQLKTGAQTIHFPLPRTSLRGGAVHVQLDFSYAYVPKKLGVNDDVRNLTVVLSSVSFQ